MQGELVSNEDWGTALQNQLPEMRKTFVSSLFTFEALEEAFMFEALRSASEPSNPGTDS